MDWSLHGCGIKGHFTYAPQEPGLRERLSVTARDGAAWRCLRCGTFVVGEPTASGPAAAAPQVRRGKELRSALILRFFAVERFVRAIVFGLLAYGLWRFSVSRTSIERAYDRELPVIREFLHQLGFNVSHSKLLGLIQHAFTLNSRTLGWLAVAAGGYALIEIIEGVGLWLLKRWGEYFAMVATSAGLPYEIYDLTAKVTVLRVLAFVVNLALVAYLVLTKRLFGVRGGKKAYEARLRSESVIQTEMNLLAAGRADRAPGAGAGKPEPVREGGGPQAGEHRAGEHRAGERRDDRRQDDGHQDDARPAPEDAGAPGGEPGAQAPPPATPAAGEMNRRGPAAGEMNRRG